MLSPSAKQFMEKHDGGEEDVEIDLLETLLERLPSEESTEAFFRNCFGDNSDVCDALRLKEKALSHPRDKNSEAWDALLALSPSAKAKSSLICGIVKSVIKNCSLVFELDYLLILNAADEMLEGMQDSFILTNDANEELSDFRLKTLVELAESVDAAKGHNCAKSNKDRLCFIIKSSISGLCDQFVKLAAHALSTPIRLNNSFASADDDPRFAVMDANIRRISAEMTLLAASNARESMALSNKVDLALSRMSESTDLIATLLKRFEAKSVGTSPVSSTAPKTSKIVVADLTPPESMAASGVGGLVSALTMPDNKGTEVNSNMMSCMFVSGLKIVSSWKKPQFLERANSLSGALEYGKCFFPRISVEVVTLTKGDSTDNNRDVFKAGSASVVRKVNYLPAYASSSSIKLSTYKRNLISDEGLPTSLTHMTKMLYDDVNELRLFTEFLPREMDALIEREIGRFVYLMSTLTVSLVDSSDTSVCVSPEGIWRGLVQLFYHQYMNAFSVAERGLCQFFYPEMLCQAFDVNAGYLLQHYSWKTSQLTGPVHNYIRTSCPRCLQSKLSAFNCITAACVKVREKESNLHVFLDATGKPSANPSKS